MLFCADDTALSPETLPLAVTVQVYVVPLGTMLPLPFVGATVNAFVLQITSVCAVTNGLGSTTTSISNEAP